MEGVTIETPRKEKLGTPGFLKSISKTILHNFPPNNLNDASSLKQGPKRWMVRIPKNILTRMTVVMTKGELKGLQKTGRSRNVKGRGQTQKGNH